MLCHVSLFGKEGKKVGESETGMLSIFAMLGIIASLRILSALHPSSATGNFVLCRLMSTRE